jgi:AcrR family transcriptional regulator
MEFMMRAEKLRTEVRQEQIAEAALRLAATEGLGAMSVAKIARHVGVVPSALYRHFRGKDEVLEAVLELIGEKMLANVRAVQKETNEPLDRLRRLLMRHVELIRQNEAIPRIIFSEDILGGDKRRKAKAYAMVQRFLTAVAEIVTEGQAQGRIRADLVPDNIALLYFGLVQPGAVLWHLSGGKFDVTRRVQENWVFFRAAIQAPA